ncbi:MAG: hypothetical protein MAG451_02625 [Anaerolineales bacterium]|nr:hypothetical protein [Anaerolineales bacterium]
MPGPGRVSGVQRRRRRGTQLRGQRVGSHVAAERYRRRPRRAERAHDGQRRGGAERDLRYRQRGAVRPADLPRVPGLGDLHHGAEPERHALRLSQGVLLRRERQHHHHPGRLRLSARHADVLPAGHQRLAWTVRGGRARRVPDDLPERVGVRALCAHCGCGPPEEIHGPDELSDSGGHLVQPLRRVADLRLAVGSGQRRPDRRPVGAEAGARPVDRDRHPEHQSVPGLHGLRHLHLRRQRAPRCDMREAVPEQRRVHQLQLVGHPEPGLRGVGGDQRGVHEPDS